MPSDSHPTLMALLGAVKVNAVETDCGRDYDASLNLAVVEATRAWAAAGFPGAPIEELPPGRYRDTDGTEGTLSEFDALANRYTFVPDGTKPPAMSGPGVPYPYRHLGRQAAQRLVPLDVDPVLRPGDDCPDPECGWIGRQHRSECTHCDGWGVVPPTPERPSQGPGAGRALTMADLMNSKVEIGAVPLGARASVRAFLAQPVHVRLRLIQALGVPLPLTDVLSGWIWVRALKEVKELGLLWPPHLTECALLKKGERRFWADGRCGAQAWAGLELAGAQLLWVGDDVSMEFRGELLVRMAAG